MDVNLVLLTSASLFSLFLICTLASSGMQKLASLRKRKRLLPPLGSAVRFRTREATYETRYMGECPDGWAIESLAHAIPALRVGAAGIVDISCRDGALRFRSEIVDARGDAVMFIRPPLETKLGERRTRKRLSWPDRPSVLLEGAQGALIDIGEGGAKIATDQLFRKGERVKLTNPDGSVSITGYVLDIHPSTTRGVVNEVRIVFEKPQVLKDLKKKFAPAR